MNTSRYSVQFGEDYVRIVRDIDDEIIYWDRQEWIDDPELVFSIANCIKLAYTNPDELIATLLPFKPHLKGYL